MTAGRVCVVGSFMMDLVVRAHRRPAAGETVIGTSFERFLGGKGFNQAVAAARSGASTSLVGRLGDDDFGRRFAAAMDREGIDRAFVGIDPSVGTGIGLPLVEDSGENSIVVVPQANNCIDLVAIRQAAGVIERADVVLLQWELPVELAIEAARIGHAAGTTVVLNPAPAVASIDLFDGLVDCLIPNESEAALMTGLPCAEDRLDIVTTRLAEQSGASAIVLTLGAAGAVVASGGELTRIAPHAVTCVDSVGAGDAFCGAMAARLAGGATIVEAATYGNAAGALAVTRAGAEASMPTALEIEALRKGVSA